MKTLTDIAKNLNAKGMQKYASELQSIEAAIKEMLPDKDAAWGMEMRDTHLPPRRIPYKKQQEVQPSNPKQPFARGGEMVETIRPPVKHPLYSVAEKGDLEKLPEVPRKPVKYPWAKNQPNIKPLYTVAEPGELKQLPEIVSEFKRYLLDPLDNTDPKSHIVPLNKLVPYLQAHRKDYEAILTPLIEKKMEDVTAPESKNFLQKILEILRFTRKMMASEMVNYVSAGLETKGYNALSLRAKTAATAIKHSTEHSIPSIETVHAGTTDVESFEENIKNLAKIYAAISALLKAFIKVYTAESKKLSEGSAKAEAAKKLVALVTTEDGKVDKIIKSFKVVIPKHPINK